MQNFRQLKVWQKAHTLILSVYPGTASFPKDEVFGLRHQMRKVSLSIVSRIAEGCGRDNDQDFHRCLNMALGHASDLEYQILLARDLGYLNEATYTTLTGQTIEVKKMIYGLLQRLS